MTDRASNVGFFHGAVRRAIIDQRMALAACILFDIDGTLLITGGASSRCIARAARGVLGEKLVWGPVTVGSTDPQIMLELARNCGIEGAEAHLERYRAAYLAELAAELERARAAGAVVVLPGVRALLESLAGRGDVVVGLLTGNYRQAVALKLAAAGLDPDVFRIVACAEDGPERSSLVSAALRQAEALTGAAVEPRQVILIGDTPRDIACARATGCRVLAVATGHYSLAQLQAEHPDAAVATLDDTEALEHLIRT